MFSFTMYCFLLFFFLSIATVGSVQLGESCLDDRECQGQAVICDRGTCRCHESYEEISGVCKLAPDKIGASCFTKCRSPLTCHSASNQCKCFGATARGNTCVKESRVGNRCTTDEQCNEPFTYCVSGVCRCMSGTYQRGARCFPRGQCPDGSTPGLFCKTDFSMLKDSRYDLLENTMNSGSQLDSCAVGQYCVTYDDSTVEGFCCKALCPYGGAPLGLCHNGTQNCPEDSHYCVRAVGNSYAVNVCCRRPCMDPTPVYVNGKCYATGSFLSDCETDYDCQGGLTMTCSGRRRKKCKCRDGYTVAGSGPGANLVCTRECGDGQISAGMECVAKAQVGWRCVTDWQCPKNSYCIVGLCKCDPAFKEENGRCGGKDTGPNAAGNTKVPLPGGNGGDFLSQLTSWIGNIGGSFGLPKTGSIPGLTGR